MGSHIKAVLIALSSHAYEKCAKMALSRASLGREFQCWSATTEKTLLVETNLASTIDGT